MKYAFEIAHLSMKEKLPESIYKSWAFTAVKNYIISFVHFPGQEDKPASSFRAS